MYFYLVGSASSPREQGTQPTSRLPLGVAVDSAHSGPTSTIDHSSVDGDGSRRRPPSFTGPCILLQG